MVYLGRGPGCVTSLHELPHLGICQLLSCLVPACASTLLNLHTSNPNLLLLLNLHSAFSSSTSTPATQTSLLLLNLHSAFSSSTSTPATETSLLLLNLQSKARSAFCSCVRFFPCCNCRSKAACFRWYPPWGATSAADGAGARPRGASSAHLIQPPTKLYFGNPGKPRSLKTNI